MTPARSEVQNVVQFLRDSLTAAQLYHAVIQDDLNPDVYTVAAHDEDDYLNSAIVGWDKEKECVVYLCHDPSRENHDLAEGIPEEDSKCWWSAGSAAMLLMHLTGEVREIRAKQRKIELDSES